MAKLKDYKPLARNPNRHTPRGLKALQDSIRQVGYTEPMVAAADGTILSGNARLESVAEIMDVDPIIVDSDGTRPIIHRRIDIADADTDAGRKIVVGSNRIAELDLSWDVEVLAGMDAATLDGLWTPDELSDLGQQWADEQRGAQEDPGAQIDKAEELREKWGTAPGQLWQLGEHRLICGDCREPGTWARLLGADKANGVFTSPPYAEQRKEQYGGVPTAEYVAWWEAVQANVRAHLAPDGSFFVNIKPHCEDGERVLYVFDLVLAMRRQWGWRYVDELCWVNGGMPGKMSPRFKNGFEPVYHFATGAPKHRPEHVLVEMTEDNKRKTKQNQEVYGPGRHFSPTGSGTSRNDFAFDTEVALPSNVLQIPADRGFLRDEIVAEIHSATFPVRLPDFFIRAYSDTGDVWVDPFCGSGTTIIAAEQNQRRGFGIELLPKYCAVILDRWATMTGNYPILANGA